MDYINYVKQQPIIGMTGFGGGAASLAFEYTASGGGGGDGTWYGDRATFAGGFSGNTNTIDYIDITSTGNASDFGDLYAAREHTSSTSNSIRGIWGGGVTPTYYNNIQYVTISTTGNANDFGDFIVDNSKAYSMTTSDSHGGLS